MAINERESMTTKYIVARLRKGEGAYSLSLGYEAESPPDAAKAHFAEYTREPTATYHVFPADMNYRTRPLHVVQPIVR